MAVDIFTSFVQQTDSAGDPISGARAYVYDVGTTTLRNVYAASDLSGGAVANPIVCDSAGRHDVRYTATGSYKVVVRTSADVTVYTRDNIDGRVPLGAGALAIANGGTGATSAGAAIAALGGATTAEVADLAADVASLVGASASTEKTHLATGTTAQRPASPVAGDVRHNTTTALFEGYIASWVNFLTSALLGTSGTKLGYLDGNNTSSGNITHSGTANFSNAAGILSVNTIKAKGKFDGATGTLVDGFNVTSVVRDSEGDYTVTIATDFGSADYEILSWRHSAGATCRVVTQAAGSFTIKATNLSNTDQDPDSIYFACLGAQ